MPAQWEPIDDAPKSFAPVWARGWDWGKVDGTRHYGWVYWDGWVWREAGSTSSIMEYLTEYLPGASPA